jgi:hypothetical protein
MTTRTRTRGITFAVQQVQQATKPLPTCKTHEALNRLLDRKVEAWCDYTSDCTQNVTFHPLLAAAHYRGSPENAWDGVIRDLSLVVSQHLGGRYKRGTPDGSVSAAAARPALAFGLAVFRDIFFGAMVSPPLPNSTSQRP